MINNQAVKICMMIKDDAMQAHCLEDCIHDDKGDLAGIIFFSLLAVLFFAFLFYAAKLKSGR